jgi:hypothetical protein
MNICRKPDRPLTVLAPALFFAALILGVLTVASCQAQTPPRPPAPPETGVDPKTGDVRMPGLVVRMKTSTVEVDAKLCLNEGIL